MKPKLDKLWSPFYVASHVASAFNECYPQYGNSAFKALSGAVRARDYIACKRILDTLPHSSTAEEHYFGAQCKALVSKLVFPGFDPDAGATARWYKAEHLCKRTNQCLRAWKSRLRRTNHAPYVEYVLEMRRFCARVLGEIDLGQLMVRGGFGPGASIGVGGADTSVPFKMTSSLTVTKPCLPIAAALLREAHWAYETLDLMEERPASEWFHKDHFTEALKSRCTVVGEEEAFTVPKNSEHSRFCSKQGTLNGLCQASIGEYVSERLRTFGIDLTCQDINARLAYAASAGLCHASTLDMSMASDTWALEAAKLLLPRPWYNLLLMTRMPTCRMTDGNVVTLEKMSAMGNGFTFPFESLMFAAVVHSVGRFHSPNGWSAPVDYHVYGDDIVCPASGALLVMELLQFLGFRPNSEKSFVLGPFKESCGADYFDGINVRPLYVKGADYSVLELIELHNGFAACNFVACLPVLRVLRAMIGTLRWSQPPTLRPQPGALVVPWWEFLTFGCIGFDLDTQSYVSRSVTAKTSRTRCPGGPLVQIATAVNGSLTPLPFGGEVSRRLAVNLRERLVGRFEPSAAQYNAGPVKQPLVARPLVTSRVTAAG